MDMKYPRTFHHPLSPGMSNDDKRIETLDFIKNENVSITIKYDGENFTLLRNHLHARSLDSDNHESRNYIKKMWGEIRHEIPENMRICGENLFAKHSIHYKGLSSYFYVFNIWEGTKCLSIDDTKEICSMLNLNMVKEVYHGKFNEEINRNFFDIKIDENGDPIEGYVIRASKEFEYNEFNKYVCKYVRENHVQTDEHWKNLKIIPNERKNV